MRRLSRSGPESHGCDTATRKDVAEASNTTALTSKLLLLLLLLLLSLPPLALPSLLWPCLCLADAAAAFGDDDVDADADADSGRLRAAMYTGSLSNVQERVSTSATTSRV